MGDVIIDGLTGANRLVILDANGKIPALDGSLVTAIAGANFSSGTIPVARLDTGTTAGKIVKLDGNAKLPAVSGAAITGVVGATKNASDPATDTNPSTGLGTEWQNTTSGEVFICTDATAGSNVWTNVGGGSGDVQPYVFQGSSYGYCCGGYNWTAPTYGRNTIDRWSYASTGNAVDVGDLEVLYSSGAQTGPHRAGGASSSTHGYVIGASGGIDDIEKYQMVASANASKVSDMVVAGENAAWSDGANAYVAGWTDTPSDMIQKLAYASDVCTDSTANLGYTRSKHVTTQTVTYGYVVGGRLNTPGATSTNSIEKYQFATTNNATDVADLLGERRDSGWGSSSLTHGYVAGGTTAVAATKVNSIEKHQFSNDGNATDVGDLGGTWYAFGSNSSTTYGYGFGREAASSTGSNEIHRIAFASDGNSADVGDLTVVRMWSSGHQI